MINREDLIDRYCAHYWLQVVAARLTHDLDGLRAARFMASVFFFQQPRLFAPGDDFRP